MCYNQPVSIKQWQPGPVTIRVGKWIGVCVGVLAAMWLVWKAPEALAGPVPPVPAPGARDAEIAASATHYAAADISSNRTGIIASGTGRARQPGDDHPNRPGDPPRPSH